MTNESIIHAIGLLTGKVIFITGASRGIGAAAARLFAREGASVVLAARSTARLDELVTKIRADGGVADAVTLDLADPASIRAAIDRVEELHRRLDGAPGASHGSCRRHHRRRQGRCRRQDRSVKKRRCCGRPLARRNRHDDARCAAGLGPAT